MRYGNLAKVVLAGFGILVLPVAAAGQKGKLTDTPVISQLHSTGDVIGGTNYRVQSDGIGVYTNFSTRRPADQVVSILQTSNVCCKDWELSTLSSTSRRILVDFRDPAPGTLLSAAPFAWSEIAGRILVECHEINVQFPSMGYGETADCPMVMSFAGGPNGATSYRVAQGNVGQPGTDSARVTCTAIDAAGCKAWDIVPSAIYGGESKNIGRLLVVPKNGPLIPVGDFYFSYSFAVTR